MRAVLITTFVFLVTGMGAAQSAPGAMDMGGMKMDDMPGMAAKKPAKPVEIPVAAAAPASRGRNRSGALSATSTTASTSSC